MATVLQNTTMAPIHTCSRRDRAVLAFGKHILKDTPYHPVISSQERDVLQTIKSFTNIPIPTFVEAWIDVINPATGEARYITRMERIEGLSLAEAIETGKITEDQRKKVVQKVGDQLLKLRRYVSMRMGSLSGDDWIPDQQLDRNVLPASDEEVFESLILPIYHRLDEDVLEALRTGMPRCAPFTMSHGDLSPGNIMVGEDGEFKAIVDWESAGYYPAWWEYVNADEEIAEGMPASVKYEEAKRWWAVYRAVRDEPEMEETDRILGEYTESFVSMRP